MSDDPINDAARELAKNLANELHGLFGDADDDAEVDVVPIIASAMRKVVQPSQDLGNLLATMHGDGGHYLGRHGIDKACVDAMKIFDDMRQFVAERTELEAEVERLRKALSELIPMHEDAIRALAYHEFANHEDVAKREIKGNRVLTSAREALADQQPEPKGST